VSEVVEVDTLLAAAWREGVGPDDRSQIAALVGGGPPVLALFAAHLELSLGQRVAIPPVPEAETVAERVLRAASVVRDRVLGRDPREIDQAVSDLAAALAELPETDPHAAQAQAWADLALGEVALLVGDSRIAHHRFEAITVVGAPITLRIDAMRQLIDLAVERGDLEAAWGWRRRATALLEGCDRPRQAAAIQLYEILLQFAVQDRDALQPIIATLNLVDPTGARLARLLLATLDRTGLRPAALVEAGDAALARLTAIVEEARTGGDSVLYAVGLVLAVRYQRAAGHPAEAQELIDTGLQFLQSAAPGLCDSFRTILLVHGR
jgi:hypothetical protein